MKEVDEFGFAIRPNKSQQKRDMAEIQDLVEKLVPISESKWNELGLSNELCQGLKQARGMRHDSGRRRQIKFLTGLLQKENLDGVRDYFDEQGQRANQAKQELHELENWRSQMVEEGDAAISAFLAQNPGADSQQLRQAVRAAKKEAETGKPAGAGRKLFRLLREQSGEAEPEPGQ